MASLPRQLWGLIHPPSAWRSLPELQSLEPGNAQRTWRTAYDELFWDGRSQLTWLAAGLGTSAASQWPELDGALAWAWVALVGVVLFVLIEVDLLRRMRRLVRQRLAKAARRGERLAAPSPRGVAALLLALGLPLLPSCGGSSSVGSDLLDALRAPPTASAAEHSTSPALHQLLDEGRFAEVRRLVADRAATPRLSDSARALYDALAQVGFGDCQAAVELTEQADDPLSERDREVLLSRSIQLMATWDTRHDSLPPVAKLGAASRQTAESRWDAAHCLLDHARERYPWREAAIERCRERIESERAARASLCGTLLMQDLRAAMRDCPPESFR